MRSHEDNARIAGDPPGHLAAPPTIIGKSSPPRKKPPILQASS
ncbi:MAG: hypothetical protein O8C55_01585 [Candidatus Methanoperedens sp.]|nr:hypothetical protein [Candidatus Methanoperedens sp.]